ncbi:hypothetical protein D3C72_1715230 [compost metagenome]
MLVNYRPEYSLDWGRKRYYTQLRLEPLDQADAQGLLTALLGDDASLVPLKSLILAKTEGNPFFMEEVVQTKLSHRKGPYGPSYSDDRASSSGRAYRPAPCRAEGTAADAGYYRQGVLLKPGPACHRAPRRQAARAAG